MRVILKNFVNLLSNGAFNTNEKVDIMSSFKWNQLLLMARMNNVSDFISVGIIKAGESGTPLIPAGIIETARAVLVNTTGFASAEEPKDVKQTNAKKFSNYFLNRQFNKIVYDEIHSIDTSTTTLEFLNKCIENMNYLLTADIKLRKLAELGFYIKANGDKIDFVKIETWFKALKMNAMMNFIGCCLIELFRFESDELPFMKKPNKSCKRKIAKHLNKFFAFAKDGIKEDENSGKIITQIYKSNTITVKYFSYCPLEVSTKFFSNITRSLSNIEE